jgi:hypothetical protein
MFRTLRVAFLFLSEWRRTDPAATSDLSQVMDADHCMPLKS